MRLLSNQQGSSIISRYDKPKPILPELKNYLAEESILQNSQHKNANYDMSYLIPKKIEVKQDKEFKPFFNERDRLGRLLVKPKGSNLNTQNNESYTMGLSKSVKGINSSEVQFPIGRDNNADYSLQKKGSLQLSSVAIMHLNEFYQLSLEQQKKSKEFQNYQLDELIEDQHSNDQLLKLQTDENENISQISKKENPDITNSKMYFEETTNEKNSKNSQNKQQSPSFRSMKNRFDQLKEFTLLFSKQDNITPQTDLLMQELAKKYTQKKQRYHLHRNIDTLPSIGQYDITKSDNVIFKKSPNPFISKDTRHNQKKEVKDSVEVYMQQMNKKKNKHSQSQKNLNTVKSKHHQDDDDVSLPPLRIRNLKVNYDKYIDEGTLFDQMNSEFYKYPQNFSEKLQWAQEKVSKIQNDLRTWDDRCKQYLQEKPKDTMNS